MSRRKRTDSKSPNWVLRRFARTGPNCGLLTMTHPQTTAGECANEKEDGDVDEPYVFLIHLAIAATKRFSVRKK